MKKMFFLSAIFGAMALSSYAQDDMYFVPKKKNSERISSSYHTTRDTYYSGSNRDVDEYNRMNVNTGSSYQVIVGDSSSSDVITFTPVEGVYPDSVNQSSVDDFELTRNMSRWDGYTPTDAYWEGYDRGRSDEWSISAWHSPWYYSSYYSWYDPWYYDPWYPHWSWHAGWYYDPWYYRPYHYYSWGWGGYYGGSYSPRYRNEVHYARSSNRTNGHLSAPRTNGVSGSRSTLGNRSAYSNRGGNANRNYGTGRSVGNSAASNRSSGNRMSAPSKSSSSSSNQRSSTAGSSSSSSSANRSSSSSSSANRSYSSGSFGGSRSSGGSFGGGNRGGGSVGGSRGGGRR